MSHLSCSHGMLTIHVVSALHCSVRATDRWRRVAAWNFSNDFESCLAQRAEIGDSSPVCDASHVKAVGAAVQYGARQQVGRILQVLQQIAHGSSSEEDAATSHISAEASAAGAAWRITEGMGSTAALAVALRPRGMAKVEELSNAEAQRQMRERRSICLSACSELHLQQCSSASSDVQLLLLLQLPFLYERIDAQLTRPSSRERTSVAHLHRRVASLAHTRRAAEEWRGRLTATGQETTQTMRTQRNKHI